MSKQFGKVALLLGGDSPEREVSLSSAQMVGRALEQLCAEVLRFDPAERDLTELRDEGVEAVFNILHGGAGEDGRIQATLETLGIAQTGARHLACAIALDKNLCKLIWFHEGLPTPPWMVAKEASDEVLDEMRLNLGKDLFVKPNNGGSSIATTKVSDRGSLAKAIEAALEESDLAMVEQCIDGSELTYGLVGGQLLPGIRIEVPTGFYDYEAKYEADTTRYICPPELPDEVDEHAREVAKSAFAAIGCDGWGRIDLMVSGREPFLLEINTIPGMTDHSLVPKAAAVAGMDEVELIRRILVEAK